MLALRRMVFGFVEPAPSATAEGGRQAGCVLEVTCDMHGLLRVPLARRRARQPLLRRGLLLRNLVPYENDNISVSLLLLSRAESDRLGLTQRV